MSVTSKHKQFTLKLTHKEHWYLKQHIYNKTPVVPAAMILEFIAEIATNFSQELGRETNIAEINHFRIFYPLIVPFEKENTLLIEIEEESVCKFTIKAYSSLKNKKGTIVRPKVLFFSGTVKNDLKQNSKSMPMVDTTPSKQISEYDMGNYTYKICFPSHGRCFQALTGRFRFLGNKGVQGEVFLGNLEASFMKNASYFKLSPLMIDSALQVASLWTKHYRRYWAPPVMCKKICFYRKPLLDEIIYVSAYLEKSTLSEIVQTIHVFDDTKYLLASFQSMVFRRGMNSNHNWKLLKTWPEKFFQNEQIHELPHEGSLWIQKP